MRELFFCIDRSDTETGEFSRDEIGHYAVRYAPGVVLVLRNRVDAERVWANVAHHYGYAHN